MLTIKQPTIHFGYRSAHDLPTPPSTSRPSPPLAFQESAQKSLPAIPRSSSPPSQRPMSGPHRSLPPPMGMTSAQPHPPGPPQQAVAPPPAPPPLGQHPGVGQDPGQGQMLGPLPAPPQGSDDVLRAWFMAKAEEERRRAEEERTRQEALRLEQRKTELNILQASLHAGVPPAMVPMVFAGMGGGQLPQAALEWLNRSMFSVAQQQQLQQLLPAGGPGPEYRRNSQPQLYGPYPGSAGVPPPTPGSAQGPHGGIAPPYAATSPTRSRLYSFPGSGGRPAVGSAALPSLNTNVPPGSNMPGMQQQQQQQQQPPHPGMAAAQQHQQHQQHESQGSSNLIIQQWVPSSSGAGGGRLGQPAATPSGSSSGHSVLSRYSRDTPETLWADKTFKATGESPRKRKATGGQQAAPPPSAPFSHGAGSTLSNPPPGRRRGHSRQRSDLSSSRGAGRGTREPYIGTFSAPSSARESEEQLLLPPPPLPQPPQPQAARQQAQQQQQQQQSRSGPHSVSSLLSEEPPPQPGPAAGPGHGHYGPGPSDPRRQPSEGERRELPREQGPEDPRGGDAGPASTRERDDD